MSETQQVVEEKRAEDVKTLELPTESATPAAPSASAAEGERKAEDVTALPLPDHIVNGDASKATDSAAAETTPAAPVEEPVKETEKKTAEPVTSGVLGYKAPGLMKQFKFSKRYFWLSDEPVSSQNLSHYLRGTEPKTAHPIAAWSSHTGKGLLFLVKAEADKAHPQDVLPLVDVTDLTKVFPHEFSFKINGHKHTFKADNDAERDGWYTSLEQGITEAKGSKDDIVKSDKYQETIKHLGAPAVAAGGIGAGAAAAKHHESKEEKKEEHEAAKEVEPVAQTPARTGSSSDEDLKKKENKSRSQSRGKRNSIFGVLKNKKEDHDVKKDEKKAEKEEIKEERAEAKETGTNHHAAEAATVGVPAAGAATALATSEESKPSETVEEPKTEAVKDTTTTPTTRETAPKPAKRNSIFGSIYQKVKSPTAEKKEHEVAPAVPPKDSEAPQIAEPVKDTDDTFQDAPETKVEEPAEAKVEEPLATTTAATAAPAAIATEEKKTSPTTEKAATPKKEKESFLGGLLSKARAKSPGASKREEKKDVPAAVEAPAVPPKDEIKAEEPVTAPAATEPAVDETSAATATTAAPVEAPATEAEPKKEEATAPNNTRRRSYFGSLGQKKEKTESETSENEKPLGKLSNIFRKPSQAIRGSNDKTPKKENVHAEKVEETPVEAMSEETAAADAVKPETAATETSEQQQSIGDVVPEAVSVGQPQTTNPTVSASA